MDIAQWKKKMKMANAKFSQFSNASLDRIIENLAINVTGKRIIYTGFEKKAR